MHSERGQATVEMALSLTVLVFLLFGIIDFGRLFHAFLSLDHAGREAARAASVGESDAQINAVAVQGASGLEPAKLTVSISPSQDQRKRGTYVTVSLSYSIEIVTPLMGQFLPNPYNMQNQTVMRVE